MQVPVVFRGKSRELSVISIERSGLGVDQRNDFVLSWRGGMEVECFLIHYTRNIKALSALPLLAFQPNVPIYPSTSYDTYELANPVSYKTLNVTHNFNQLWRSVHFTDRAGSRVQWGKT